MRVWGLVRVGTATEAEVTRCCGALSEVVEGLSAVSLPTRDRATRTVEGDRPARTADSLSTVLSEIPAVFDVVCFGDADEETTAEESVFVDLAASLDSQTAGVARAAPVTDALKQVAGERLVAGLDRSSLTMPASPQLARRRALEEAVAAPDSTGDPPSDPVSILASAGFAVRLRSAVGAGVGDAAATVARS